MVAGVVVGGLLGGTLGYAASWFIGAKALATASGAVEMGGMATDAQISGTSYAASQLVQTQPSVDPNEVNAIARNIAANGPNSVDPILVRIHQGVAYIVDGHHRFHAFLQLGYDRVPIKYLHESDLGRMLEDGTVIRTLQDVLDGARLFGK